MNALPYLAYAALKESGRERAGSTRRARSTVARPSDRGTGLYCLRAAARRPAR
jgi:hypothetical protein